MLGNLFSTHQTAARAPVPNLRTVNKLAAALAGLPAPWRVLRNRRASAADGPPWVKYIALHPEKGIALLDLLPANPHAAVAPLDEFLARTGFAAFSHGDPPIVALALGERDIAAVGDHLADAFADAPRCGIKNANWTEAVVELLLSTSGLFLTPIERASNSSKRDRTSPAAGSRATTSEHAAKPPPGPPPAEVQPPEAPPPDDPPRPPAERVSKPPPSEARRREAAPPNDFLRPAKPGPAREPSLAFLKAPDPELRVGRLVDFERHNGRRRHLFGLSLVAASLAAGAILAVHYVHAPGAPPATTASIEPAPSQPAEPPTQATNPATADTEKPATAPPAPAMVQPPPAIAPPQRPATPPPHQAAIQPPPAAATPQRPATTPPHAAVAAAPPFLPDARTRESATVSKPTKAQPAPALGGPAPSREPSERSVKEAQAKPVLNPPPIDGRAFGGDLAQPPATEETTTVDGTTYIKGREPRALGTVTEPESEPGFEPDN